VALAAFLAWQWSDYPAKHRSRLNLVIHIVAVPLFMLGCLAVVAGIMKFAPPRMGWGLVAMVVSVVLEGLGHRFEVEQPAPFAGFGDFVKRFFLEQWVTFPRFVLSGHYFLNLAGSALP
jgi:uncharacterized membrane protein YGL010W